MSDITKEVEKIQKASRGEEVRDAIVTVFQKLEKDQDDMIQKDQEALDDGMRKSVYDTDGDGVVDNSKKVDGHTVAADVPADAKFTDTDTVYNDTELRKCVSDGNQKLTDLQAAVEKAATKEELQAAKTELEGKIGSSETGKGGTASGSGTDAGAGSKTEVTVDAALSETSENPVQNKAVVAALKGKQDTLTFDNAPTVGSNNPVTSGGVAEAIGKIVVLTKEEVQKMIDTSIRIDIDGALAEEY